MAKIIFYTKLGCSTSSRQVDLLKQSGHQVEVRNLLEQSWTADELDSYFGEMPLPACFNPNSPRVKSGEIDPAGYERQAALELMLEDHLLIRRPLMESGGSRMCGFDPAAVHAWVGLGDEIYGKSLKEDFTSCSQPAATPEPCP